MFDKKKLGALYQLLEDMTRTPSADIEANPPKNIMQRIEKVLVAGIAISQVALVIVALWYRFISSPTPQIAQLVVNHIYLVGVAFSLFYLALMIVELIYVLLRHRKERFAAVLEPLKRDFLSDAKFVDQLLGYERPLLEYALTQYRHSCGIADGRMAIVTGDIRKVGLFPALAAAAMSAATLIKDGNNLLFWAPLILACCFYFLGFFAINRRERTTQVLAILEYAVQQSNEQVTPPFRRVKSQHRNCDRSAVPVIDGMHRRHPL